MTLVLGIETATTDVAVALAGPNGLLASFRTEGVRRQEETLHPAIVQVLKEAGAGLGDLGAIGVDVGPGRFTGLRVGVAAAKTLSFALATLLVGVTSTEILCAGAAELDGPVIAVVDLRRGEVAALLPGAHAPDDILRLTPTELGALIAARGLGDAVLVGDGALEYLDAIRDGAELPLRVGGIEHRAPSAGSICALCTVKLARGETTDASALAAVYLRGADVHIGWSTRDATSLAGERAEVS